MFEMSNEEKELDEIFHGEDKPLHPDTIHKTIVGPEKPVTRAKAKNKNDPDENTSEKNKPANAQWEPVRPEPNQLDKLKESAKFAVGFGGLSFLLFYWEQAGLMASSIAVPCMCICTALAGWGIGKNAARGKH